MSFSSTSGNVFYLSNPILTLSADISIGFIFDVPCSGCTA